MIPNTLLDLSAKIVAEYIPFESIERRYEQVPEPVQRRIIFWSFPRSEDDIMMYSSLSSDTFAANANHHNQNTTLNHQSNRNTSINNGRNGGSTSSNNNNQSPTSNNNGFPWLDGLTGQNSQPNSNNNAAQPANSSSSSSSPSSSLRSQANQRDSRQATNGNAHNKQLTFYKGLNLYREGAVRDVLQIGFNLNGLVRTKSTPNIVQNSSFNGSRIRGNNQQATNSSSSNNSNYDNINNHINASNNNNNNYAVAMHLNNQAGDHHPHHNLHASASNTNNDTTFNHNQDNNNTATKNYRVSVTFDRCKITSVSCSCEFQDIFWCEHVVALILYRIRNPETIDLRVPISETLLSLDRQQLQKLVQYIIAEHYTDVLPTAQRLLDDMRQPSSEINQIQGAPDPTAGACVDDEHIWHLDELQVNEKVQNYLNLVCINSKDASKQITSLFEKIREMFRAKDSNGTRLLKLITEQFLIYATRNEKSRPLWDQLVSLWVVVMLNPNISKQNRKQFSQLLNDWSKVPRCPKEDIGRRPGIKRKAAELSDDEDSDGIPSPSHGNEYLMRINSSNNYPAHMATHRHRTFQSPGGAFPVLKPFNHIPFLSTTCPCQNSHPIEKRMRTHSLQHCNSSQNDQLDAPGSSNHQVVPRNQDLPSGSNENRPVVPTEPRSVFHRALDFRDFSWTNPHLQYILNKDEPISDTPQRANLFDSTGCPLWNEGLPQAAARIETLRSHGYRTEALRLTVASVRRLKVLQDQWFYAAEQVNDAPCMFKGLAACLSEGWIGHPLDPVNIMVDLLLDASLIEVSTTSTTPILNRGEQYNPGTYRCPCPYNRAIPEFTNHMAPPIPFFSAYGPRLDTFPILPIVNLAPRRPPQTQNQASSDKSTYNHTPVPGCCQKDSYLSLAYELALMALAQQRSLPTTATAHDRAVRQEADLIAKLESIDVSKDPILIDILRYQSSLLLRGGPFHNACCGTPADSAPIHTFCRYLFDSLVSHCPHLAYKIGVYALKMPLSFDENSETLGAARTTPRGINYNHLQSEQLALAQSMLSKAKDEINPKGGGFLHKVYRVSIKNIRNPASLLKLSKHALKEAKPNGNTHYLNLLRTAFDLGLQVLKMTLSPHTSNGKTRREAVIFIIECATDMGLETVSQLMKDARDYFSAIEALNLVVTRDNDYVNLRTKASSKLKIREREEELNCRYRELVLDCASRDPSNCALDALRFCENHHESLKIGLKIVIAAGTSRAMDSTQLIKVADWIACINGRGWIEKAFQIAMVAVDSLSIPSNSDNSSSKKDIFSACEYAQKVHGGFSLLIPKLIENIECAIVLSDIYHRFHPNQISPPRFRDFHLIGGCKPVVGLTAYNEDVRCWDLLLKRTLERFIVTTRTRLQNISPRHYAEFIEFLVKAQETFEKADNGPQQFKDLINEIMKSYRTKKKLIERLRGRFEPPIKAAYI